MLIILLVVLIIIILLAVNELFNEPYSLSSKKAKKMMNEVKLFIALKIAKKQEATAVLRKEKRNEYVFSYWTKTKGTITIDKDFTIIKKYNETLDLLSLSRINPRKDFEDEYNKVFEEIEDQMVSFEKFWRKQFYDFKDVFEVVEQEKQVKDKEPLNEKDEVIEKKLAPLKKEKLPVNKK